jgi:hypothetical protein
MQFSKALVSFYIPKQQGVTVLLPVLWLNFDIVSLFNLHHVKRCGVTAYRGLNCTVFIEL